MREWFVTWDGWEPGEEGRREALATVGNGYVATGCDRMPRALYEAIRALEGSTAAVEILGADVVAHYLNAARVEQQAFDEVVHPWERQRYLERG